MPRHRRASPPSDEVVGGFSFDFEPFRTTSRRVGESAVAATASTRRFDAVDAMPRRSTAEDLAKAEPAVEAAMAALDSLDPKSLTECKGMIKPPGGVDDVFAASMVRSRRPAVVSLPQYDSWP